VHGSLLPSERTYYRMFLKNKSIINPILNHEGFLEDPFLEIPEDTRQVPGARDFSGSTKRSP